MKTQKEVDVIVIGGGIVGSSIGYGLAKAGKRVRILDQGDDAFRASRGNGGLVWVQGKGLDLPSYARWTMASALAWPSFAAELLKLTSTDVKLSQVGGLFLCLSEEQLAKRRESLTTLRTRMGGDYPFEILGHSAARKMVPEIGPEVVGATFGPMDGHVSPLRLMRALVQACSALGADWRPGVNVERIQYRHGQFHVFSGNTDHAAPRLVLAAGLGNKVLAPMVGLRAPILPERGQMFVTERLRPFLRYPCHAFRQTDEGVMQLGVSNEDVGINDQTSIEPLAAIADEARRVFPLLENVNIVRSWGAVRILTPDGMPIYEASKECPGAFLVTCHSGITLAAQHSRVVADWILGGEEPSDMKKFKAERFNVQSH